MVVSLNSSQVNEIVDIVILRMAEIIVGSCLILLSLVVSVFIVYLVFVFLTKRSPEFLNNRFRTSSDRSQKHRSAFYRAKFRGSRENTE